MATATHSPHELAEMASDVLTFYDKQNGLREAMVLAAVPDQAAPAVLAVCHEILDQAEE